MIALRRLLVVLASLMLVASACSSSSDGGTDDSASSDDTSETTAVATETTAEEADGSAGTRAASTTTTVESAVGDVGAFELSVGDCLVGSSVGEVSGFEGVPCEEVHDSEVFHLFDVEGDGDFPGDAAFDEIAQETCLAEFEPYVGVAYVDSPTYDISFLEPTARSWSVGDREIVCLLVPFQADSLTGSGRGAGLVESTTTTVESAIGDVDAFELSVGDCLRGSSEGEVSGFEGVPCDDVHDSEVFHLFDFADGEFPGDEGFDELAVEQCLEQFTTYVGIAYADSLTYDISWLEPTARSWGNGDREIVCLLVPFEADSLTGSGRGAAE